MSVGKGNRPIDYTLDDTTLGRSYGVRDLGAQESTELRTREQCIITRNRTNKLLGFIGRCMTNWSSVVILRLHLALVRSYIDYAAQFWSLYYRKDMGSLEAVQRRMTKMIQGLRNLPYKDKLKYLNLHSLERRAREDMIEIFKWVKSFHKENIYQVLEINSQDRTSENQWRN